MKKIRFKNKILKSDLKYKRTIHHNPIEYQLMTFYSWMYFIWQIQVLTDIVC